MVPILIKKKKLLNIEHNLMCYSFDLISMKIKCTRYFWSHFLVAYVKACPPIKVCGLATILFTSNISFFF